MKSNTWKGCLFWTQLLSSVYQAVVEGTSKILYYIILYYKKWRSLFSIISRKLHEMVITKNKYLSQQQHWFVYREDCSKNETKKNTLHVYIGALILSRWGTTVEHLSLETKVVFGYIRKWRHDIVYVSIVYFFIQQKKFVKFFGIIGSCLLFLLLLKFIYSNAVKFGYNELLGIGLFSL